MATRLTRRAALLLLILAAGLTWPAPTAAAPPRGKLSPSNDCFIRGIYHDVLGRLPDASEISFGLSFLASNTNEQYATSLLTSTEYRALLIEGWYQKFLGRAAGSDLAGW